MDWRYMEILNRLSSLDYKIGSLGAFARSASAHDLRCRDKERYVPPRRMCLKKPLHPVMLYATFKEVRIGGRTEVRMNAPLGLRI